MKSFFNINDQDYYLKILKTESEVRNNPKVIDLLNRLATESEIDLNKRIKEKGGKVIVLHKPTELWQVSEKWLTESFETEANRAVFVIEDKTGYPLHVTIALINDPLSRSKNKVMPSVGTYIYVTHAVTQEEWKGKGLFGLMLDKINTMYLNPKRKMELPIDYSISVSVAPSVYEEDQKKINHVMNLPAYSKMWKDRFTENKVQIRFQHKETGLQEGRNRINLEELMTSSGFDEQKMSDIIETHEPIADSEKKFVRGAFMEGKEPRNYLEAKHFRKLKKEKFIHNFKN